MKLVGDDWAVGWLGFVGLKMRQSQIIAMGHQVQARADALMSNSLEGDQMLLPCLSLSLNRVRRVYQRKINC